MVGAIQARRAGRAMAPGQVVELVVSWRAVIDHPAAVRRHRRNGLQVSLTGQRGVEVTFEARRSAEVRQEVRDAGSAV